MGFQIGAFRFDRAHYAMYFVYFKDISGLSRKAEVKIAGVKIGWVESVTLVPDHEMMVQAEVMINKDYQLYADAYAIVRQDGLLGPKYLEIVPGNPMTRRLEPGEALSKPSKAPVQVDEVLQKVKAITSNMEEITDSFKEAVGGVHGKEQLHDMVENMSRAAERLASFSESIDRAIGRNEENIDNFFAIGADLRRLADKIESQVVPSVQSGVDKVSHVLDRDFDRIATTLETTAESFEDAALQARESLRNFNSVVEKIDEGKGLLGKLINEDDTYRDLKVAAEGLKNYFAKIDRLQIVFDSHFETMQRPAENYRYEDSKGYFDIRIHPTDDYFYLLQLVASERGFVTRKEIYRQYCNEKGELIDPSTLNLSDRDKLRFIYDKKKEKFYRGAVRFGLQFGKVFNDIAFRFGIFDSTFGVGIDFDIPFKSDKLRWVTTFEAFDLTGWNRIQDRRRPHLKWINRVFMFRNIYVTFGADDFVSKHNASAFFGFGLRFGDNDIKYYLPSLSGAGAVGTALSCN
jgi:phospholipid/cholesterol/gamma-HCH transport system substrate-binding protein